MTRDPYPGVLHGHVMTDDVSPAPDPAPFDPDKEEARRVRWLIAASSQSAWHEGKRLDRLEAELRAYAQAAADQASARRWAQYRTGEASLDGLPLRPRSTLREQYRARNERAKAEVAALVPKARR